MYFHSAINKYGFENFLFEKIDEADTQEILDKKERYWIKFYKSNNKEYGYNLDSGGKSGNKKSEETKRKIGVTTSEKWRNPITAEKMRNGLLMGAETMKRNAKKYPFICPVCNKTFYYQKNVAENKKYCSLSCATKGGAWKLGVDQAKKIIHAKNIENKQVIKDDIIKWSYENKEIIDHCPYNKIETTLSGLKTLLVEKYGIKDLRSIFICFDVKNKRTLLDKLKESIYISKENVC